MPRRTRTPAPTPEHHARPAERATWSPEELSKFSTQVADSLRLVHSDLQQRPGGWFTGTGYDAQPTELWLAMYEPWLRQEAQGILGNEVERRDFVKGIDQDLQRGYCLDSVIETVRDTTPDAWKAGVRDTVTAQLQALQGEAYGAMRADEKMARTGQAGLLLVDAFAHEGANSWRTRAYNAYAGVVGYPEDPDLIHGVLAADLFVRAALGQQPHPELVTKLREYADHLLHGSSHNSMNPLTDIDTRIAMQMARALNGQSSKNRSAQHSYMQTVAQAARYDIDSLSAATTTAPKPAKQRRQPSHPATHAPVATPAATTLPYPQDPHGPTDISFLTESADSAARRRRIAFSATAVAAVVGVGLVASPAAAEDGSSTVRRAPSTVRIEIAPDTSVAPAAPEQTTTPGGIRRSGGVSRAQARVLRDQAEQARQAPAPSENSVEGRRRLADNLRLSIAAALRTNELTGLPAAVQGMTQLGLLEGWFTGDPLQNELTRGLTESKNLPTLAAGYSREAAAWLTLLAQYPSLATSSANSQLVQQLTFRGFEQDAPVFEMYLQQNKAGYEAVLFEQQSRDAYPGEIANHLVRLLALADFYNLSEERVQGFRDQYAQAEAERVAEEERVRQEALAAQRAQEEAARSQERQQQTLSVGHIFAEGTHYTRTSEFGPRWGTMHRGEDLAVDPGTPVLAPARARVVRMVPDGQSSRSSRASHGSTGNVMVLQFEASHPEYPGAYIGVDFAHLNGFAEGLKEGDVVERGQVVAYSGNTGRSTGPHVHINYVMIESGNENDFRWSRDTYDPDVMYEKFGNGVTL